jgi:excisionase family DNA binding protein
VNLKQAARTLGIHYQTAYKLVRSGRLAAVRVGGAYEVSDAAIAAYLAEKDAMGRAPVRVDRRVPTRALDDMICDVCCALDTPGVTAEPVLELVAETLAVHLGDVVVVQVIAPDGHGFVAGPVRHVDPRRRAIVAANATRFPLPYGEHPLWSSVTSRETILVPHVRQDGVRAHVPPDLIQHLDEGGVHSFIAAPAMSGGDVYGIVFTTRDAPGRPYTDEDAALVSRLAGIAGVALRRGRLAEDARRRRGILMERLMRGLEPTELLADGADLAELVCDADGRVVAVGAAALRWGHARHDAVVGRDLAAFVAPGERAHETEVVRRLLVGELPSVDVRRTLTCADGRERSIVAHHGVARDAAAHALGLVVVAYEVV